MRPVIITRILYEKRERRDLILEESNRRAYAVPW
jgi:hypothetical protein